MYKYDKSYFEKRAKETGFIRDNLEKIFRLADILEYINRNLLESNVNYYFKLTSDLGTYFCKFTQTLTKLGISILCIIIILI